MAWPKATEIAILEVNGMQFQDWETVLVKHALSESPPYHCRFTCSEGMPLSKNLLVMQIKPGDTCKVTLAGFPAFYGKVETRQVYYDSTRHHIELQCATFLEIGENSVIHPTGEWRNKTFKQIGQEVLDTVGIKMVFEGGPEPTYKFDRVSHMPGETIYDFMDMLARGLSQATGTGISFTSNIHGDFVVIMGPNGGGDIIAEGRDIIIGRELIYNPDAAGAGAIPAIAQSTGNNKDNMTKVASSPFYSQVFQLFGKMTGTKVIVSELPIVAQEHLKGRTTSEGKWLQRDQITVWATVYGWLRPTGGLWYRDQHVIVRSPMLMMNDDDLIAKSVTFTQDNVTGTRTVLELCNSEAYSPKPPITSPGPQGGTAP